MVVDWDQTRVSLGYVAWGKQAGLFLNLGCRYDRPAAAGSSKTDNMEQDHSCPVSQPMGVLRKFTTRPGQEQTATDRNRHVRLPDSA